jgi:acetate kinase
MVDSTLRVLAVNAGSSSLKLSLIGAGEETLGERELATADEPVDRDELRVVLGGLEGAQAVGHRVVHGGVRFSEAVRVDGDVEGALRELTELAPLHQPRSLAALDAVSAVLPGLPAVACFDTAFHATIPTAAATYALPAAWRERWPLRRFGFHGLSHAWIARRAGELVSDGPSPLRIVSCHLGAGASLCAIDDGRSVDTTMGFTPLEGLVMATRSGSVDPGLLLWLADGRLSRGAIEHGLEHDSGLVGLAGSADMREVLERAASGVERAALALDVYTHRLRGGIAAMAASLGGIDVLAFTGGVGQNASAVRELAVGGLGFLGIGLDATLNRAVTGDADIGSEGSTARVLVIEAREDLEIARQTRLALRGS